MLFMGLLTSLSAYSITDEADEDLAYDGTDEEGIGDAGGDVRGVCGRIELLEDDLGG
jgi:hypothetical protein